MSYEPSCVVSLSSVGIDAWCLLVLHVAGEARMGTEINGIVVHIHVAMIEIRVDEMTWPRWLVDGHISRRLRPQEILHVLQLVDTRAERTHADGVNVSVLIGRHSLFYATRGAATGDRLVIQSEGRWT